MFIMQEILSIRENLNDAFANESEHKLLKVLSDNPFLFYHLFKRHYQVQPIFKEVPLGNNYRCDFVWLNDNSDGPEWTIVEVEKPGIKLFKKDGDRTAAFNHALEQIEHWDYYFNENPSSKREIFGAVKSFRFILVVGTSSQWNENIAARWRYGFNKERHVYEVRSLDVFTHALDSVEQGVFIPSQFTSQKKVAPPKELFQYVRKNEYLNTFRQLL